MALVHLPNRSQSNIGKLQSDPDAEQSLASSRSNHDGLQSQHAAAIHRKDSQHRCERDKKRVCIEGRIEEPIRPSILFYTMIADTIAKPKSVYTDVQTSVRMLN